ncbi:MAG: sulfite exporter TauE/SafE family protein [Mucilaginibacter sp.]|jgi:hypothetical protein
MEIIGYLAAGLIGISLSLIGGGGSILTVPIMVYLFSVQPSVAISYSLFVVGAASLVGACNSYRKGLVNIRTALLFGTSSIITVFLARRFVLPAIPHTIARFGAHIITLSLLTMILFAITMVFASVSMIRSNGQQIEIGLSGYKCYYKVPVCGVAVGLVSALLGIGGGFMIVPVLVLLLSIPVKQAIGTSLLIITLNSFIGFMADFGRVNINWQFLLTITFIAVAGIFAGYALSEKIPGIKLKKGFGWMLLFIAGYIITREVFLKA